MSVVVSSSFVVGESLSGGGVINGDNPLIAYDNIATTGNVSTSTAATGFPATNLANPSTNLRWVGGAVAQEYLTIINNDVAPLDYIAIAKHNLYSDAIPVSVEAFQDPDSFTKLLLHFNGADASTSFLDSSPTPRTFTASGNAQIDTAQSKFGGASGLFDGTGDYITTPDNAAFALGGGAFTIETWFRCNQATGSFGFIASQADAAGSDCSFSLYRTDTNFIKAEVFVGGTAFAVTGTTQFTNALNTGWHHVALVRTGNILRLFIDGIQEGGDVAITGTVNDSAFAFTLGARGDAAAGTYWLGWLDEFRLSVGVARWTANFTPPVAEAEWIQLIAPVLLPNDGPALFRFPQLAYEAVRLRMQAGTAAPTIAVVYAGALLVLQRRVYVGHTPINYGRSAKTVNARSESGNFLGRIVINQKTATKVDLKNLTAGWYRSYMEPFLLQAQENPFFFAWRPSTYPYEVGYCWLTNDPQPNNQRNNGMMSVDLELGGIV